MRKKLPCKVTCCPRIEHARGWCRAHYNEQWRWGVIRSADEHYRRRNGEGANYFNGPLESAQRVLAQKEDIYAKACGWKRRLQLWREIEALRHDVERMRAEA